MASLLEDYLDYTSNSASPESYHIWTCLSMVASVIGKKSWIRCNYYTVYPNLYILLASQPGVGKKSTAMRIGRNLVKQSEATVNYSNDSQTSQVLMEEMKDSYGVYQYGDGKLYGHSSLTVLASELVTLLIQGPQMIDFLTDIYDSDTKFEYKTKNVGRLEIVNPCLNILAGVTTDNLNTRVIKDAAAGGFMSRSIIVYDNKIRPSSSFDLPSDSQEEAAVRVVEHLSKISKLFGEFTFTPEAKAAFQEFENAVTEQQRTQSINIQFISRKDNHAFKVCMLIAAMDLVTIITEKHVKITIELLKRVEQNMKFIHMSSGQHANANIHSKVISALAAVGGSVEYNTLLEHFMADYSEEDFRKSVDTMALVNYIEIKETVNVKDGHKIMVGLTTKGRAMYESL